MSRTRMLLLLVVLSMPFAFSAGSKDKAKTLPAQVLQAQTILVVISPDAGEPLADPSANRNAREDVEKALLQWGRFRLAMEPHTADLVLSVRKGTGRSATPTVSGGPIDNRPVILQPGGEGGVRIGGQRGRPDPVTTRDQTTRPSLGTQIGTSEDTLELYLGGNDYPLDSSPIWRYTAKDALHPPKIPGIEELRKAINETEKATQQKKKP
jgi:hypothetical protein